MPILIDNPHELGSDRLVNAVACFDKVGGRCLSVDFGTSINVDAVSADGEYLGGVIAPGLEVSIDALSVARRKAAAIPAHAPRARDRRSTQAALQSGFAFGFAGLVDGVVARMREELGADARVIATGGLATRSLRSATRSTRSTPI